MSIWGVMQSPIARSLSRRVRARSDFEAAGRGLDRGQNMTESPSGLLDWD